MIATACAPAVVECEDCGDNEEEAGTAVIVRDLPGRPLLCEHCADERDSDIEATIV